MKVLPFNNTTKTAKMMELSDLPLFILRINSLQDFRSLHISLVATYIQYALCHNSQHRSYIADRKVNFTQNFDNGHKKGLS